jgi:hypothetical protein
MDTEGITGSGSFVDADGAVTNPFVKQDFDNELNLKYLVFKGCQFDPAGKAEDQL